MGKKKKKLERKTKRSPNVVEPIQQEWDENAFEQMMMKTKL